MNSSPLLSVLLLSQLKEKVLDFILLQDEILPHLCSHICNYLSQHLPKCWVGHAGLIRHWCSSNLPVPLTYLVTFSFEDIGNTVCSFPHLHMITGVKAVGKWCGWDSVDQAMLAQVWKELDYYKDVCCVTEGTHIAHLWLSVETWSVNHSILHLFCLQ